MDMSPLTFKENTVLPSGDKHDKGPRRDPERSECGRHRGGISFTGDGDENSGAIPKRGIVKVQ
jgi:hypothetical protein